MKRHPTIHRPAPPIPSGFTMIELLVVMGIIIFLVSMTVAFVGSAITTARDKNTKATIKAIDSLLTARLDAFTIWLQREKDSGKRYTPVDIKELFKRAFPQNLKEAFDINDTTGDVTASSEAMYEFLINGETFGAPPVGEDAFKGDQVGDTDNDGRREFLDGWGQPLRFYRWPTRLIRPAPEGSETEPQRLLRKGTNPTDPLYYQFPLNPDFGKDVDKPGIGASVLFGPLQKGNARKSTSNPEPTLPEEQNDPLARDPDDPLGTGVNRVPDDVSDTAIPNYEARFHTPDTWSLPLIVSAGPDGVLGLYEPVNKANHGHLAQPKYDELDGLLDNITNRKLQP